MTPPTNLITTIRRRREYNQDEDLLDCDHHHHNNSHDRDLTPQWPWPKQSWPRARKPPPQPPPITTTYSRLPPPDQYFCCTVSLFYEFFLYTIFVYTTFLYWTFLYYCRLFLNGLVYTQFFVQFIYVLDWLRSLHCVSQIWFWGKCHVEKAYCRIKNLSKNVYEKVRIKKLVKKKFIFLKCV